MEINLANFKLSSVIGSEPVSMMKDFIQDWPELRKKAEAALIVIHDQHQRDKINGVIAKSDKIYNALSLIPPALLK